MADIHLAPDDVITVGIDSGDDLWLARPVEIARVRATDLRNLAHRARSIREERPGVPVLVDIDVMIAPDSPSARSAMAELAVPTSDTLLYVGTPSGLAGLITDIHVLGIADGAVLRPLDGPVGAGLIRAQVLPGLQNPDGAQTA